MAERNFGFKRVSYVDMALDLATKAHRGQKDKSGRPFILHPVRVASYMHPHTDEDIISAALLHDVVEDTDYTLEDIKEAGFSDVTVKVIDYMTRRGEETYKEYIYRVGMNAVAAEVKLADLRDNMDERRAVTPAIRGMIAKRYVWSKEYLEERILTLG